MDTLTWYGPFRWLGEQEDNIYYRREGQWAGVYLWTIQRGSRYLTVERPDKLELVVHLKTAEALGLTLPPTLLFQADEVIK